MKKTISILGSTGSIGQTSLKAIDLKKNSFLIISLSAHKNFNIIVKQINKYNPKNFIVSDYQTFLKVKKKFSNNKVNIFNNFNSLKLIKRKIDITVSAIPGIAGLKPTLDYIKISKKILLANKESVICGWNLIKKSSEKNKTKIIPIDSEHFSIMQLLKKENKNNIEKIIITASGGPFLNLSKSQLKKIKPSEAINHPKWSMGKKISIDSATMVNKIIELIEAQKIFSFPINKFEILIHPQSLVHAIIVFKNGITKFLYHEPDMIIPISNAIYDGEIQIGKKQNSKFTNIKHLSFVKPTIHKFPILKLITKLDKHPSAPIIFNATNEIFVDHFLNKKISFPSILDSLFKVFKHKNYKKYAIQNPVNLEKILNIDNWSRKVANEIISTKKN